nr:hypothetical protein [Tanacetum cinerariifolium]
MANIPPNDPNVDASAIVPALVNPDHAPAQPAGLRNGFAPHWIGGNIHNNQIGWIEEDAEEEEEDPKDPKEDLEEDLEEDPKEDPEEDDDDDMEVDDETEVIDPYIDDGSNNPPPPNTEDEETPTTSPTISDADGQPIPPIASFGQNFHFGKMEKLMSERIDTEGRMKKKFKEQDRHFVGLGCDNIEMDRAVRNVMSDLSGLKKLVNNLSNRFDEYEGSKVFEDKKVLEKELVNERNGKEFYQEFDREPPAEPSTRSVPTPYPDDPYVVTRDATNAAAVVGTFDIDDDDDTTPIDSQPYEPHMPVCRIHTNDCNGMRYSFVEQITMPPRKSTRGNPPPPLIQDTVNRMIQESVEATIRAERENFMNCSPITFRGNEGAVATLGMKAVTRKTWAEIKVTMTEEFCPPKEIQRMECELCNLRVKEMDISSYTTRFNELMILCPGMVPTEQNKVEAYIRGLSKNIKGEVTLSELATLNKAVWMAHTLMEQKVKAIAKREADNKKMKWENFQGGSSSGGGNRNSNRNNNNYS